MSYLSHLLYVTLLLLLNAHSAISSPASSHNFHHHGTLSLVKRYPEIPSIANQLTTAIMTIKSRIDDTQKVLGTQYIFGDRDLGTDIRKGLYVNAQIVVSTGDSTTDVEIWTALWPTDQSSTPEVTLRWSDHKWNSQHGVFQPEDIVILPQRARTLLKWAGFKDYAIFEIRKNVTDAEPFYSFAKRSFYDNIDDGLLLRNVSSVPFIDTTMAKPSRPH